MSNGKETYDERKRLQAENALLRERRENDRLNNEQHGRDTLEAISAFFAGSARIHIDHGIGGIDVRFIRVEK